VSELRQDWLSGEWVVIAPERGARPRQLAETQKETRTEARDKDCPFCPGNEARLDRIIEETLSETASSWLTRRIPNRYPALSPDTPPETRTEGVHRAMGGQGIHHVIIESPLHDTDIPFMNDEAAAAVVGAWLRCHDEFMNAPGTEAVFLFRNRGLKAGASLRHPHSQAIATRFAPPRLEAREERMNRLYERSGRCPLCETVEFELQDRSRVFMETEHFVGLVSFAATCPFEFLIVPRHHAACFSAITQDAAAGLAFFLRESLRRLYHAAGNPPYNLALETASRGERNSTCQHWHLRIAPDITTPNGFDLSAGMPVNPHLPESDATTLHNAAAAAQ
jgi:UDPglucose--hexose-1-phosphate uridylyltransferase